MPIDREHVLPEAIESLCSQELQYDAVKARVAWLESCLITVIDALERVDREGALELMDELSLREFRNFLPVRPSEPRRPR
jgi:hypothetical protein